MSTENKAVIELYAVRNKNTGRLLVLNNDSTIEPVRYSLYDEKHIYKKFDVIDSDFGGTAFVTHNRADAQFLIENGSVDLCEVGIMVVYNGWRYLDRPSDGKGNFTLSDLEVISLRPAA